LSHFFWNSRFFATNKFAGGLRFDSQKAAEYYSNTMLIRRCDLCKKKVDVDNSIKVGAHWYANIELCHQCGKFIINFLKKKKLYKGEKAWQKI